MSDERWTDLPPVCILTGAAGENADDCTTHEHDISYAVPFEAVPFEVDRVSWKEEDEDEETGEPVGPLLLFNRALNAADPDRSLGHRPAGQFRVAWTTLRKAREIAAAYGQELEKW